MAIIYRSLLDRDLTPGEVDENFRTALDSANSSFAASGSGAVSISVQNALRVLCVTPLQFEATWDGVADDTAELQAAYDALNAAGGGIMLLPEGNGKISARITTYSNIITQGAGMGATTISCANGDIAQLFLNAGSKAIFRDFTISVSVAGTTSVIGGLQLNDSTDCRVERVEVTGVSWAGVLLYGASRRNTVRDCYFHDWRGSVQDSADIALYNDASYNFIANNACFGGGEHGVMLQGSAVLNGMKNIVTDNRVSQHTTYGIMDYRTADADTYTQITDNYIEDIQGTTRSNASGMGIYLASVGGVLVSGNTIRNCCVQTTATTLTPGAIGINGTTSTLIPCNITNNNIDGMTKYAGIWIAGSAGGNIVGNRIQVPTTNDDGYGAIYLAGSSNLNVCGNHITIKNASSATQMGIEVNANANIANIAICNNVINGGSYASIRVERTSSNTLTGCVVSGNIATGGNSENIPLRLSGVVRGMVTGNYLSGSSTNAVVLHSNSTHVRYENNVSITSQTDNLNLQNTNTASFWGKSNYFNGEVENTGTGMVVEQLSAAEPAAGTAAVGDTWWDLSPTAGATPGGMCTTAGAPGTWKNFANLAA